MCAPSRLNFSIRVSRMALLLTSFAVGLWASELLAQPGTVLSEQKISATEGGFTGTLDSFKERFGCSLTSPGDLDGDGIGDLAVGASRDDDGGAERGAVWMLFLDIDGTVKSHQKISDTEGGFAGALDDEDLFGFSIAALDDLDGDGVSELAVGAAADDDGGTNQGAVWVLFLDPNGTVKSHQKISSLEGAFTGALSPSDNFGYSVASLGDINGDGVSDLAVGAIRDDDGGTDQGAVWILFLNPDGTVSSHHKISSTQGGFTGMLDIVDYFGNDVAALGDLDGDGVNDLAVGAAGDDDGGQDHGAVWILFLDPNGAVKSQQKISSTEGGFTGPLSSGDNFGVALAQLAVLDGDGVVRLAAGAKLDDYPEPRTGAVWILSLDSDGTVHSHQKIGGAQGGFMGSLDSFDYFGFSAASLGDLNGDGVSDLAVGAVGDDDGGEDRGALWILFLDGVGGVCGDGILETGEECDDGNNVDGDGCSATCRFEAQPQNRDQQRCIKALNKSFVKVAKARGKAITRCIKDGSKGKLSGAHPIETCMAGNNPKVEDAKQRTKRNYDAKCVPADPPDFGATNPDTVNQAAIEKEIALIRAIFGSDLDAVIVTADDPGRADARAEASCQAAAVEQSRKCQHSKLMTFVACKKDGLNGARTGNVYPEADDPFDTPDDLERCMDFDLIPKAINRTSKACDPKLGKKLRYECENLDIPSLFPGECSSAQDPTELKDCFERLVECHVCQELNQADALNRDCDEFDDGVANGSCP